MSKNQRRRDFIANQPMMSQSELERKYNSMLQSDSIKGTVEPNRTNVYSCACGNAFKTIDIDKGVTPFYKACPVCGSLAKSNFYKDNRPDLEATFEWYRPSLKQCMKWRTRNPEMLEHVLNGGLDFRPIEK